ncbi:uncharacterized protein SCHCODRAFT_02609550 [Schizophyllum commune H4-8]|uniref:uncharacterized protein n=1 Tax=Schizophyllum commune (strain H4-8 / FGSC 9210) TaxID=578458 RepID=UPI00215F34EE|nr:uncharacterized protein SCHCODRAFT_02609550 [Schizophyllum commune H4-8]KAI5897528.1 hypothetical protein SCHCODRAFT_02609550 [Schizophyllum commune H4-8]
MLCTKWFLPLFFLPLPTAPPLFLLLFIISLVAHAKPCFYCIILISTIFLSSCYWQPLPIDSPLTVPWSAEITTFRDALRAALGDDYDPALQIPQYIRPLDRCWCDLTDGMLEPFNVSQWERDSVMALRYELVPPPPEPVVREEPELTPVWNWTREAEMTATEKRPPRTESGLRYATSTAEATPSSTVEAKKDAPSETLWRWLGLPRKIAASLRHTEAPEPSQSSQPSHADASQPDTPPPRPPHDLPPKHLPPPPGNLPPPSEELEPSPPPSQPDAPRPMLLKEDGVLDLRPYGITLLLDFRWSYQPIS